MKDFWKDITKMWLARHGLTSFKLWLISFVLLALSIIGIITQTGNWQRASLVLFSLVLAIELGSFFIELPYKKWKRDTEKMSAAYQIQMTQNSNPLQFLAIEPHTVYVEGAAHHRQIYSLHAKVRSLLLKPITIKSITGNFRVPLTGHEAVIQFESHPNKDLLRR